MRELIGLLFFLTLIWLHFKNVDKSGLKPYYLPALILKIVAGIAVGVVYKHYYIGGDTWNYFYQGKIFSTAAFSSWSNFIDLYFYGKYHLINDFAYVNQPRAALMVKLVAIVNLFTNTNYWLTSVYFSFFSFIGVWAFATWIYKSFNYGKVAALILFIWPSFVFWSSGILKETIAVGLIFWIIATYFKMLDSKEFKNMPSLLVAMYFLFSIKYYFAVVLFVVLILYGVIFITQLYKKSYWKQALSWFLMLILGFSIGGLLHPNLRFANIMGVIISNNVSFVALSSTKNIIHFINAPNEWAWLFLNTPKALFAGLFLPLSLSRNSLLYSFAAFENWVLTFLFLRGIFLIRPEPIKTIFNLLLASISYIGILAVFLALSTPNLGTLVRYRVAYIPVLLVLVVLLNRFNFQRFNLSIK